MKNNPFPKEMKVNESVSVEQVADKLHLQLQVQLRQILGFVNDHLSQKEMQEKLNLPKYSISRYIKRLENLGYLAPIPHTKPRFFELTASGKHALEDKLQPSSLGVSRKDFRLHNFSVQLPILKDTSQGFWEKSWDLNGWKKQFKKLQDIGVSVERTPKNLTINFQARECNEEDIFPLAMAGTVAVAGYLVNEGIELDLFGARVSRQEYASPEPLVQEQLAKGLTFRQSLGRLQERIMPNDEVKPAYVWFDSSKGAERDTNDLSHMRKTAMMPETVEKIAVAINGLWGLQDAYAQQIKVHLEVMNQISGMISRFNRRMDQKNLKEFL